MFFIEKGWHPVHFQYGGYVYANGSKEQGIFLTWTRCYVHVHVCRNKFVSQRSPKHVLVKTNSMKTSVYPYEKLK